ncbi:Anthranilate synthase component I protein [Salinisphaera shabanensis E1L3A]|uniref:Anthranilate synthase component I protein n=1 Tax=Salinisphaera shabanensis E1L3A TaxID=1033802 RepID=U2EJE7_9GAMM|nr:aminodeoxychorismate synthase component I [Salinisphaera shabanensis]ERJ18130.1 Anthranilate synthase component I protein [Salinisphaera shabanensis E1L3A]
MRESEHGDLRIVEIDATNPPDLARLAAMAPSRYPFLLESSAGAAAQSRYDLLLAYPAETISVTADDHQTDFFAALDRAAANQGRARVPGLPFVGGWFIYLGYEMAGRVEPSLRLQPPTGSSLPDALAVRCPAAFVHDRRAQKLFLIAEQGHASAIDDMRADLLKSADVPLATRALAARWQAQPAADYIDQVMRARELIHAGDVFQTNLSRAWHGRLEHQATPARVYAALRQANPAPFSGLMQWGDAALVCSSPERLVSIDNGIAQTRPIAGTRMRSAGTDADMADELISHPKERAEHVMLIDLERNDLGRVCRAGTISVDELMCVESYAHVHHIVSNIRGTLAPGVGPGGTLRAVFPGGTITGCPKVRCMEIIAELEREGRGAYTGSFGYLSRCGRLDTNIVIRSLTQSGRDLTLRTGAGIVADSIAGNELEETRVKARGVLRSFVDAGGRPHG